MDSENRERWLELLETYSRDENILRQGGGPENIEKQHAKNSVTARERIQSIIDPEAEFFELGIFPAHEM